MTDIEKEPVAAAHIDATKHTDITNQEVDMSIVDDPTFLKEEKKVVLKQDLVIMPCLALGLFFAYLDRGAIGNARVLGMQDELNFTPQQFYNCVMMFYVGYMLFDLPAALTLRYIKPRFVIGTALVIFGTLAALLAVVKSYAAIMVIRVGIGLGECFVNVAWIFASQWYRPSEMGLRAGAFSGLIAYAIGITMEGRNGLNAWEWLFIVEGCMTVGFGIVVWVVFQSFPEDVAREGSWLFRSQRERNIIRARFKLSQNIEGAKARWHLFVLALKDPKIYAGSMILGAQGVGIGSFSVFLPTFVREFGFGRLQTQLITIIPYSFAIVGLFGLSYLSDKVPRKAPMVIALLGTTATGFIILLSTTNTIALVAGSCFVAGGAYPCLVISVAWTITLHGGYTKRATATTASSIVIQGLSMVSSQVYRHPPRFFLGHGFSLGVYLVSMCTAYWLYRHVIRENKKREQTRQEWAARGEINPLSSKTFEDLGDFHPDYRYTL
ncbi:hypothetical protein B0A52_04357 [Exophiala mesophila]|uniref:Major facilitator superfamily (MFS) profile domain-containing protein n=1 Tax=Exophiala mesophila TaxID=212818 RepID=A0A438N858_EXOME|nr:hypothetical protein B0A52_04357 [Exophiala mesophila]